MKYEDYLSVVEEHLEKTLKDLGDIPHELSDPMLYSLSAGGKRIRPVLCLAAADRFGGQMSRAIPYACALEMIHTYSLIHDDLPALDNDPVRRHKPSCHIAFGEDMAILAGDGLLSAAAEVMLKHASEDPSLQGARAAYAVMHRAGITGMVAGQTRDVVMEGKTPDEATVRYIHLHKTADLLTAPVEAGLILAGCDDQTISDGVSYAQHLGLAFQMMDDLLDATGDSAVLGKRVGLDAQEGKMTWVALRGIEGTRADVLSETETACMTMKKYGDKADFFIQLAQDMVTRVS